MKTYKTWEVIKMLTENPKLRFTSRNESIHIYEDELVWLISNKTFKLTVNSGLHSDTFNRNWALVQTPVTFMEAIEAFISGRNVRSEYISTINGESKTQIFYQSSKNRPGVMKCGEDLTFYIIATGKWFIEED